MQASHWQAQCQWVKLASFSSTQPLGVHELYSRANVLCPCNKSATRMEWNVARVRPSSFILSWYRFQFVVSAIIEFKWITVILLIWLFVSFIFVALFVPFSLQSSAKLSESDSCSLTTNNIMLMTLCSKWMTTMLAFVPSWKIIKLRYSASVYRRIKSVHFK